MPDVFEGTVFEELRRVAESGDFSGLALLKPDQNEIKPVQDGDKVLGELTPLETAILTLVDRKNDEHNLLCDEHNTGCCGNSAQPEKAKTCDHHLRTNRLKSQIDFLNEIFWPLVNDRLQLGENVYTLRQGLKVVEVSDEEKREIERERCQGGLIIGLGGPLGGHHGPGIFLIG
jgi:hypothetical protein